MDLNDFTLMVLSVIVLAIWILGLISPGIKRLRVSAVVSFIFLYVAAGLDKLFPLVAAFPFALILWTLILRPSFSMVLLIYAFLNIFGIATGAGEKDIWVCVLVFSFVINTFVIFGIIRLVSYIWKKCFTL